MTSAAGKNEMKGMGLQMALDIVYEKTGRDVITGLKTKTHPGRPNWQEVRRNIGLFLNAILRYIALRVLTMFTEHTQLEWGPNRPSQIDDFLNSNCIIKYIYCIYCP